MYLCTFRPSGEPLEKADLFGHLARLRKRGDGEPIMRLAGPFALVADDTRSLRPLMATYGPLTAVGDVRLDNRTEIAALAEQPPSADASDLEVVLRALDARGDRCVGALLGDFAFVVWNARAHKLIAARDAFGVKPLYWTTRRGRLSFSSSLDVFSAGSDYDLDHIADILAGQAGPVERTIWSDVRAVPAGGLLVQRGMTRTGVRYWTPDAFAPDETMADGEACEQFLGLFRDGIRTRLGAPTATWAQLSGGLDSSSVVLVAQSLSSGPALNGTVTVVDSLGNGDERKYSDAVLRRVDLRNEQVRDYWAWQDDGTPPPSTDDPRPMYPFYARDRRMCDVVRTSGGRVLLSGFGSDHYLCGNLHYVTDMARAGRVGPAVRELAAWAVTTRRSFWSMAREYLGPLVPAMRRTWYGEAIDRVPSWIDPSFARRYGIEKRLEGAAPEDGPGGLFAGRTARDLLSIPAWVDRWPFGDDIEVRYPFLHRPLVEASLQLPARMRIRPQGHKWVLREALRGTLPEEVRTRVGKGTIDARILWSLQRERHRVDELLRDPILGQLGCIKPAELRDAVDAARRGIETNLRFLMSALSLETWLAVRSGRWTARAHAAQTAA
jgi:asparagine synthase (glutamine-hydrolysing)